MPEPLQPALESLTRTISDLDNVVRAVGTGRRRGEQAPPKVTLRPVDLKTGPAMQEVTEEEHGPITKNVPQNEVEQRVRTILARPYGNWHVETPTETIQLRVTKSGDAQVHRAATSKRRVAARGHDREKERLIPADDPLFSVLGAGADKRRQVDAFLRLIEPAIAKLPSDRPLVMVDLGAGNAYLTFAAHRYLTGLGRDVTTVGVDLREDLVEQANSRAAELSMQGLRFVTGRIGDLDVKDLDLGTDRVDVVLALHACDTATDDSLAQAVSWQTPVILAAPCCHHDVQRQWSEHTPGAGVPEAVRRSPILRERFADVVTDALRAEVLRAAGYSVDVVEFIDSRHTPRNAMIRANRSTDASASAPAADRATSAKELAEFYGVRPALMERINLKG